MLHSNGACSGASLARRCLIPFMTNERYTGLLRVCTYGDNTIAVCTSAKVRVVTRDIVAEILVEMEG